MVLFIEFVVGDIVIVWLGGSVFVDGWIIDGWVLMDELMVMGEFCMVVCDIGDFVMVGIVVMDFGFCVEIIVIGDDMILVGI